MLSTLQLKCTLWRSKHRGQQSWVIKDNLITAKVVWKASQWMTLLITSVSLIWRADAVIQQHRVTSDVHVRTGEQWSWIILWLSAGKWTATARLTAPRDVLGPSAVSPPFPPVGRASRNRRTACQSMFLACNVPNAPNPFYVVHGCRAMLLLFMDV